MRSGASAGISGPFQPSRSEAARARSSVLQEALKLLPSPSQTGKDAVRNSWPGGMHTVSVNGPHRFPAIMQIIMEPKDLIAVAGISVTFVVSCANLVYSLWSNKRTVFVNTVTASRLKWIDSLRDKVSEFIAVTTRLLSTETSSNEEKIGTLLLQRDMLLHQIILHLNPHDPKDQRIRTLTDEVRRLTTLGTLTDELSVGLLRLRDATGEYLKKEWNRVKEEST
jgi:hypothetical protein